jgi:hypothetical protein
MDDCATSRMRLETPAQRASPGSGLRWRTTHFRGRTYLAEVDEELAVCRAMAESTSQKSGEAGEEDTLCSPCSNSGSSR